METHYFVVLCLVDHHFRVAVLLAVVVETPLEGFIYTSVRHNVLLSKGLLSVLFAVAAATVFNGREDSRRDVLVAHESFASSKQSVGEQAPCHDSSRG
jgi:hypothetical protein